MEQLFGFSLDDFVFFGLNGFFEIFGLLGQEALGVDLVKLFDERLSFCWGCGIDSCGSIVKPLGSFRLSVVEFVTELRGDGNRSFLIEFILKCFRHLWQFRSVGPDPRKVNTSGLAMLLWSV